jgi:mannose-6-phosphate isomerase-like protein (cupin superfamily)
VTEATGHVVPDSAELEPRRNGDTTATRVTIDASHGARLEQRVVTYAPGLSHERTLDDAHAVMYVSAGHGRLHLDGEQHELDPESGVFVAAGETFSVENGGPEPLELVEVCVPQESPPAANRRVVVRYRDQPVESAGIGREFRHLVDESCGIAEITQFVGTIPPGRAPMHSHEYDEVGFVIEGEGVIHWDDGRSVPVRRGSCIHFPRLKLHSLENSGTTPMRIMGVFHPQLSPASRVSEGNN